MNKDQIIQMARQAGFDDYEQDAMLERFAASIRAATKEEDAKICYIKANDWGDPAEEYGMKVCAEAILASK